MADTEVFTPSVCKNCTIEDCEQCDVEMTSEIFWEYWKFLAEKEEEK